MNNEIRPSQSYINESRAKALVEKWSPVLDYNSQKVNPIEDDHTRLNTAILLENQEQWCLKEATNTAGAASVFGTTSNPATTDSSDFYAAGDARLPKILIPMIRRTFPELITNEIVGVQPMSGPVGLAFALRYKYADKDLEGGTPGNGHAATTGVTDNPPSGKSAALGGQGSNELGHNHLATGFTGSLNTSLSSDLKVSNQIDGVGGDHWLSGGLSDNDAGFAAALSAFEMDNTKDNMPTVELSFEKTAVEAGTRRLGARWSVELEQDLKNMNGIDVDAELTNAMSYEIQAEIDREMIIRMVQSAVSAGSGTGFSTYKVSGADARWMAERNRDFYQKLIVEANRMAVRNRRGAANFIVATPRICAILEMLPEFSWMTVDGNVNTQPVGVAKVGNVGGRFNVYRDTRTEAQYNLVASSEVNKIEYALLGYKGPEYYDTGIIYCPYIPVMVQRSIDPNSFYPKVGMLTRYGVVDHLFGASNYYHVVFVLGLGTTVGTGAASYTPFQ